MRDYTVRKSELLDILKGNRERHQGLYQEARTAYLLRAQVKLGQLLDDVNAGRMPNLLVDMPVPEDHTRDYDRVIRMLEMDLADDITITDSEAKAYVQDDWPWRRSFIANTVSYTGAAAEYAGEF